MWLRRQQNPRYLSSPVSFRRFYLNFFRGLSISLEWSCCRLPPSINGTGMPSSSSTLPLAATAVNCSVVLPLFSSLPQSHSENGRGRNSFSLSGSDSVGSNNSIPSSLPLLFSILKQHSAPSTRPTDLRPGLPTSSSFLFFFSDSHTASVSLLLGLIEAPRTRFNNEFPKAYRGLNSSGWEASNFPL